MQEDSVMTSATNLNLISTSSSSMIKIEDSDEDSEIDVEIEDTDIRSSRPVDLTRSSTTSFQDCGGTILVKNEAFDIKGEMKVRETLSMKEEFEEDEEHLKPDTTTNIQGR